MDAHQRSTALRKAFDDALASPLSVLVLDNLERILGFSSVGPQYSHEVLQTLHLLLRRVPPEGRRLLVLGTTSSPDVVQVSETSWSEGSPSLTLQTGRSWLRFFLDFETKRGIDDEQIVGRATGEQGNSISASLGSLYRAIMAPRSRRDGVVPLANHPGCYFFPMS